MSTFRALAVAALAGTVAACGGDRESPTAPGGPRRALGMTIVATAPTMSVGDTQQLRAIVAYADGSYEPAAAVAWGTSQETTIAIWPDGVAVAIAPGSATITATAGALTSAVALAAEARPGNTRRIQGRLVDFTSGAPLGGVTFALGPSLGPPAVQTTTTDGSGGFAVDLPAGEVGISSGGRSLGFMAVRVSSPAYRGDLVGNGGTCISRYGTVTDARTFQPIAGATVTVGSGRGVSDAEGWYRIDLGCVDDPFNNSNTTSLRATHPAYRDYSRIAGRGVHGVTRFDVEMQRP